MKQAKTLQGLSASCLTSLSSKFCLRAHLHTPSCGIRLIVQCEAAFRKLPVRNKHRVTPHATEGVEVFPVRALRPEQRFTPAGWVAVLSIAGILAAILYRLLQKKKEEKALPEYQDEFMHSDSHESPEFQLVLATVRQNVIFQRALLSLREGDNSRAMVELHRMLEENAICRKPLNLEAYTEQDREDVYRLHLQNSEFPLQYSTLLHLRQLLEINNKQAESLEKSLGSSAYDFSI